MTNTILSGTDIKLGSRAKYFLSRKSGKRHTFKLTISNGYEIYIFKTDPICGCKSVYFCMSEICTETSKVTLLMS